MKGGGACSVGAGGVPMYANGIQRSRVGVCEGCAGGVVG